MKKPWITGARKVEKEVQQRRQVIILLHFPTSIQFLWGPFAHIHACSCFCEYTYMHVNPWYLKDEMSSIFSVFLFEFIMNHLFNDYGNKGSNFREIFTHSHTETHKNTYTIIFGAHTNTQLYLEHTHTRFIKYNYSVAA